MPCSSSRILEADKPKPPCLVLFEQIEFETLQYRHLRFGGLFASVLES